MALTPTGPYTEIAAPTQRGLPTPFCRKQTGKWSPTNGWVFDQDFNCLDPEVMGNLAALYGQAGCEYTLTLQNGIATLEVHDTTGTITIDVWEVVASRINESVFADPVVVQNVSANDLTVLARAYLDGSTIADAISALQKDTPTVNYTTPDVTTPSFTQRLWQQTKNGQEATFQNDRYSLRHTTNASNRGHFNVADVNINCIYTQSQLYSEIQNAHSWYFPAPAEIIDALNNAFNNLGTPPQFYMQGALKGGSNRVTAANNTVNIVTEYQIGIINQDRYAPATIFAVRPLPVQ